jgi:hypothetical protein
VYRVKKKHGMMSSIILIFEIFTLKEQDSYVQSVIMKSTRKKKKTKDYDILPEEVEEEYMVWFW